MKLTEIIHREHFSEEGNNMRTFEEGCNKNREISKR